LWHICSAEIDIARERLLPEAIYITMVGRIGSEERSLQVDSQLRVVVPEAGDSSGTQKKGNVRRWKPLPSSTVKAVTENTSLYVIVICKV
jgi:hypothetical protein